MNSMPAIDALDGEVIEQLTFLYNALADKRDGVTEHECRGMARMLGRIIQDLTPNREP